MSLIFIDGMEDLTSWTGSLSSASGGRNGRGIQPSATSSGADHALLAAEESDTLVVGFAFKTSSVGGDGFLHLRSDASVTSHVILFLNSDGSIAVQRAGTPTTLATTATGLVIVNTWCYIEFKCSLHDSTGAFTLNVNGSLAASATSQDTKNGGTKTVFDTIQIRRTSGAIDTNTFDDFYVMNGSGDTFLGDVLVETLYPDGNGNANQWVGSDSNSTDNYLLVDDPSGTSNATMITDYTASSTTGEQDMYTLANLTHTTGTIIGVQHTAYVSKDDAGAKQVKLVNRRSADNKSAALTITGTTPTYNNYQYLLTQDPETSAAWTIANVNALQSGIEVV